MTNLVRKQQIDVLKPIVANLRYELVRLDIEKDYLKENFEKLDEDQKKRLTELEGEVKRLHEDYIKNFNYLRSLQIPYEVTYSIQIQNGGLQRETNIYFLSIDHNIDTYKDKTIDLQNPNVSALLSEISEVFYYTHGGAILHAIKKL